MFLNKTHGFLEDKTVTYVSDKTRELWFLKCTMKSILIQETLKIDF